MDNLEVAERLAEAYHRLHQAKKDLRSNPRSRLAAPFYRLKQRRLRQRMLMEYKVAYRQFLDRQAKPRPASAGRGELHSQCTRE
jgi:hypothetical protein